MVFPIGSATGKTISIFTLDSSSHCFPVGGQTQFAKWSKMNVNTYDNMIYTKNTTFRLKINNASFALEFIPGCCSPDSQRGSICLAVILPGPGGKAFCKKKNSN